MKGQLHAIMKANSSSFYVSGVLSDAPSRSRELIHIILAVESLAVVTSIILAIVLSIEVNTSMVLSRMDSAIV